MGAPKGNKNGKGNAGGRPSAYAEKQRAEALFQAFYSDNDQEALERKIGTGKFSIWDRIVLTAMEGDTKVLNALSNKAFPDQLKVEDERTIKLDV